MEFTEALLFVAAGGLAGLAGGLLGIGGGLIFTPTLFFYFKSAEIAGEYLAPLSIGTGLLCTWVVAVSSAVGHNKRGAVIWNTAVVCGIAAAFAAWVASAWITTAPWFTADLFQRVFALFLVVIAVRMMISVPADTTTYPGTMKNEDVSVETDTNNAATISHPFTLIAGGGLAGLMAATVGVGGGIVLVPLYSRSLKMNIRDAVGTSSATIAIITLTAIITFALQGSGLEISPTAIGYVDFKYAAILAIPAAFAARFGVRLAHRTDRSRLRQIFGALALLVAIRMILGF